MTIIPKLATSLNHGDEVPNQELAEQPGAAKVRLAASVYYGFQGLAVGAWWFVLYFAPASRQYFLVDPTSETALLAFWLADLAFLGVGSLVTAWLCYSRNTHRQIASWFVTGAVSYAAIYCLTLAMMTDVGWLGVTLMLPAMIWSGVFAVGMSFRMEMFRQSAEGPTKWIVFKTFTQIVIVWMIILVVIPYMITVVEGKIGITQLSFPFQRLVAAVLFVLFSSIGIYGAYVMSKVGRGTPLPLDHAQTLVVVGPYRYVRNPMAVSGIGQGLMVALFLGSPFVALYALMGSLIWQLVFRPLEEDDLQMRFGEAFERYRQNVRCWVPRLSPYQIEGTADSSNSIDLLSGSM